MNLALIDPFILAQDYPDTLTSELSCGHATSLSFNRKGDFLASGRVDGTVVIVDVETNGIARKLRGHSRQIQSLSWSRDGRYLLSSSQDWKCILWDLQDGSRVRTVRFEAPVYIAELHPFNHLMFVASLFEDHPVLVDISSPRPLKRTLSSAPLRPEEQDAATAAKIAAQDAKQSTCVTIFDATGSYIFSGTSKGWINIIATSTCETIYSKRLCNGVVILLRLSRNERDLLMNSSDRVIRTILMPDLSQLGKTPNLAAASDITLETQHKFQDVVNRLSWNHVAFSSTGEFVTASTFMNPDIYVWERSHGSLVKILEGPREELGVVEWHPNRPMIVAAGLESGCIYTWSIVTPQKWSALASDFGEVDQNVPYVEREDEFDLHPAEEVHKRRLDLEDEVPDVLTMELAHIDSEGQAFRMPVILDISDSESSDDDYDIVGPRSNSNRKKAAAGGNTANGGDNDGKKATGVIGAASGSQTKGRRG